MLNLAKRSRFPMPFLFFSVHRIDEDAQAGGTRFGA
jgi:hypothetical protein